MTFSMQGVGNFTNTAVLCVLLAIYSSTEANKRTHVYTGWRYTSFSGHISLVLSLAGRPVQLLLSVQAYAEFALWFIAPARSLHAVMQTVDIVRAVGNSDAAFGFCRLLPW